MPPPTVHNAHFRERARSKMNTLPVHTYGDSMYFGGVHIFAIRSRRGLPCIFLQIGPYFGVVSANFRKNMRPVCRQQRSDEIPTKRSRRR